MPTPRRRARSKSPGPRARRPQSSPAAVKAEDEVEDEAPVRREGFKVTDYADFVVEPHVQLGICITALVALSLYQHGLADSLAGYVDNFFGTFAGDVSVPHWPFGLLLTGHVLNSCQHAGSGFWIGSLTNSALKAFAGVLLVDFMNGNKWSILADESNLTLVAVAWYLCNHDVPVLGFNVWKAVSAKSGAWLQTFLDLCTTLFVTKQVIAAAATSSAAGPLGFSVFTPLAMAFFAGAGGHFFPLNKGIKINKCTPEMYRALAIGSYIVFLPVLKQNVFIGGVATSLHDAVSDLVGGHEIIAAVIVNHFFGSLIPFDPVGMIADALKNFSGV